jgi:hypothetical protein
VAHSNRLSHRRLWFLTNLRREAADFRFQRWFEFAFGGMSVRRNAMKPHGLTPNAPQSFSEAEVGRFELAILMLRLLVAHQNTLWLIPTD